MVSEALHGSTSVITSLGGSRSTDVIVGRLFAGTDRSYAIEYHCSLRLIFTYANKQAQPSE